jgi:hypothetical protein
MDESSLRAFEAAGVEVERTQARFEVDVDPLTPGGLRIPHCHAHELGANTVVLVFMVCLGVQEEGMIASVPGNIYEPDE